MGWEDVRDVSMGGSSASWCWPELPACVPRSQVSQHSTRSNWVVDGCAHAQVMYGTDALKAMFNEVGLGWATRLSELPLVAKVGAREGRSALWGGWRPMGRLR